MHRLYRFDMPVEFDKKQSMEMDISTWQFNCERAPSLWFDLLIQFLSSFMCDQSTYSGWDRRKKKFTISRHCLICSTEFCLLIVAFAPLIVAFAFKRQSATLLIVLSLRFSSTNDKCVTNRWHKKLFGTFQDVSDAQIRWDGRLYQFVESAIYW